SYIDELRILLDKWAIRKVSLIVPGNPDGGDRSINNGLRALSGVCNDDDIILIHDGVRPLIDDQLISKNIQSVKEYGSAITVEAVIESVAQINDKGVSIPTRSEMFSIKAPQSFPFGVISKLYTQAEKEGLRWVDSAHLCSLYGMAMHFVDSSNYNMKITKREDYFVFRALYEDLENRQFN
ncbi:MAG: 2-C-methyl-D-erythritol 4-phosphate cytidylyltransferase, partial [Oscillospiraceae bacterium]|nr:2-C-methyl-D-erythritol 4-phosphate cytidylyltransferase [Oscillospiraceae bacterium]